MSDAIIHTLPASEGRPRVTYRHAGDRFLLLEYGDMVLDLTTNFRVFGLNEALTRAAIDGVIETVPALRSMLIHYDGRRVTPRRLVDTLLDEVKNLLQKDFPHAEFRFFRKESVSGAAPELLEEIAACDAVIGAVGD